MVDIRVNKTLRAIDVKLEVLQEFLYGLGFLGVFLETINGADILGIKRSLYTTEVEVKVDKYDLIKEIKAIRNEITRSVSSNKIYKHKRYLGKETFTSWRGFIPNEFYFAVPSSLRDVAIDGVRDTPYGVITVGHYLGGYQGIHQLWGVNFDIRAKKIHKEKIDNNTMLSLMRKTSIENFNLRRKINGTD